MIKFATTICFFFFTIFSIAQQNEVISVDTTIVGVWDAQGSVIEFNAKVLGGTIKNAYLKPASKYKEYFDTSVTFVSCKVDGDREFSTAWFGAKTTINYSKPMLK